MAGLASKAADTPAVLIGALANTLKTVRQGVRALPAASPAPVSTTLLADARGDAHALPALTVILGAGAFAADTATTVRPALLAGAVGGTASSPGADLAEVAARAVALLVGAGALPRHAGGGDATIAARSCAAVTAAFLVDATRHTSAGALEALPVQIFRAWSAVGFRQKYATEVGVAGIRRARIAVIAVDDGPLATQGRASVNLQALVGLGTGIAVVAANAAHLPLQDAGVCSLLGGLVAPRLLTWILGSAVVRIPWLAGAGLITGIVVRTGVPILAGVSDGLLLNPFAHSGQGVAGGKEAIVHVVVLAVDDGPFRALSVETVVVQAAPAPIFTLVTICPGDEDAAKLVVARIDRAVVRVVAHEGLGTHADAVLVAGVNVGADVAVVTRDIDEGGVDALAIRVAGTGLARFAVIALLVAIAQEAYLRAALVLLHYVRAVKSSTPNRHSEADADHQLNQVCSSRAHCPCPPCPRFRGRSSGEVRTLRRRNCRS